MSSATPLAGRFSSRRILSAVAIELLACFFALMLGTLAFVAGWLSTNGAAALTTIFLLTLLTLAWINFDRGRHPCFLFLGTLLLLQGGRLLSYCAGDEPTPLKIVVGTAYPFDITRHEAGIVLFCVTLSAICVYAPCRWSYLRIVPPSNEQVRKYLPYLYALFYATLPVQLFKNFRYYEYVREHGGYATFFINHANIANSIPFLVRAVVLINLPAFMAIFVFEENKKKIYAVTALYFAATSLILLLGLRGAVFGTVVTLWYVAAIKSNRRRRITTLAILAVTLVLVGTLVDSLRESSDNSSSVQLTPLNFIRLQGNSLNVTEVAVKYRSVFEPYAVTYLWNELKNAFVANDTSNYFRGKALAFDVPVLLDRVAFSRGYGTGGSYIAEAYVIGGIAGVAIISLLIGGGLHLLYRLSGAALSLLLVAMVLPDVVLMPRGELLDWLSVLLRNAISFAILFAGWKLFIALRPAARMNA